MTPTHSVRVLRSTAIARFGGAVLLLAVLLGGCGDPDSSVADAFRSMVRSADPGGIIDLADLPASDWTDFAVVPGAASEELILEATGLEETFNYPLGHDLDLTLILVRDGNLATWAEINGDASADLIELATVPDAGFVAGTASQGRFRVTDTGERTVGGGTVFQIAPLDAPWSRSTVPASQPPPSG